MSPEEFERHVRQLEGMRLKRVRYYELPGGWPAWNQHADFDSVDHGLDLLGEDRSFCVTWDNTFWNYGLRVDQGVMLDQLWGALVTDVTQESRWTRVVGQRISSTKVYWCPVPETEFVPDAQYPQDIEIRFEGGDVVLLSAAVPQEGTPRLFEGSDNVVVLFGEDAMRELSMGHFRPAE